MFQGDTRHSSVEFDFNFHFEIDFESDLDTELVWIVISMLPNINEKLMKQSRQNGKIETISISKEKESGV